MAVGPPNVSIALLFAGSGGTAPRPRPRPPAPPRPPPAAPRWAPETPAYAVSGVVADGFAVAAGARAPNALMNLPSRVNSRICVSRGPVPAIHTLPLSSTAIPALAPGQV